MFDVKTARLPPALNKANPLKNLIVFFPIALSDPYLFFPCLFVGLRITQKFRHNISDRPLGLRLEADVDNERPECNFTPGFFDLFFGNIRSVK